MWYPSHFITIPLGYLTIFLLAFLSRKCSPRARVWIVRALMLLLFAGEIAKQIVLRDYYSPNYLPFHYSSTYYVSFALYAFGCGRVRHYGACASYVGGLFLLVTMTVNPHSVVGDTAYLFTHYYPAHSYFFHMAVLLLWLIMLFGHDYQLKKWDFLRYCTFLGAWAAAAIPAAFRFQVNYAGLLRSFIRPLERIRLHYGQVVYLLLYTVFILLAAGVAFGLYRLAVRLTALYREKKQARTLAAEE